MDPISILSVATAVVTFTDFSAKIISRCREIRNTGKGAPEEMESLTAAAEDLLKASSGAREKLKDLRASYPDHTDTLERLTSECAATEKKMKDFSARLNVPPRGFLKKYTSPLVVAVRSSWSKAELEDWDRQLSRVREQITLVVLTCIWEDTKLARERAGQTDEGIQKILEDISRIGYDAEAVKISPNRSEEKTSYEALWETTDLVDFQKDSGPLHFPQTPAIVSDVEARILQSLSFQEMSDRGDRIATAYPTTFEWLFKEHLPVNGIKDPQHTGFSQWLRGQNRTVFWICGKPASGKSTLMKFISRHDSLSQNLRTWARRGRLHIATFYFWGPGSTIQRSRNGLLRALLHQLLSERPELISAVAPRRHMFFSLLEVRQASFNPEWSWTELCECFYRFASYARQTNTRVALFIDGLDEYGGNTEELTSFLLDLHRDFDLKLCVSSRPWNVFTDAFRQSASLTMERLTGPDIEIYVEQKLCKSPAIEDLRFVMPKEIDQLISEIKTKAKGVFLWVVLVVEQLIQTSREDPRFGSIREVFDGLPDELETLYNRILGQIGTEKQLIASRLYQLVMEWKRTWNGQIPAIFLWLAINIADPTDRSVYPGLDMEEGMMKPLDRLLKGHTRGILQVSENNEEYTVDFLHRTAFEWLRMERNWSQIREQGGANYQAMLYILRVLVSHICSVKESPFHVFEHYLARIFMLASEIPDTLEGRSQLVHIIDDIDQRCFDNLVRDRNSHLTPTFGMELKDLRDIPHFAVNIMTYAAAWSCCTYLHGKLDTMEPIKKRSFFSTPRQATLEPLLNMAMGSFGNCPAKASSSVRESRRPSIWQTSKRLRTIHFLLQRGAKISRSMSRRLGNVRFTNSTLEQTYVEILQEVRSSRNMANSLAKQLLKHFPANLVATSRSEDEYPDFFIRTYTVIQDSEGLNYRKRSLNLPFSTSFHS
ncbi:hypothetical protein DM02DRAFT_575040 [Periconia macrospinosa]|uniref:Nephrocystin 3-like N-terminal domain-containing protein n=1 Tax=Periconia macrospinosa TaxID=97972 RepID=A0A2V1D4G2_9PLEO|nr:hypothetical protein DM02DRAFT_575040 [Periconia macrospinosa]